MKRGMNVINLQNLLALYRRVSRGHTPKDKIEKKYYQSFKKETLCPLPPFFAFSGRINLVFCPR